MTIVNNVIVIGSGGREHCLAWKLAQSELVQKVFVSPGNGGVEKESLSDSSKISCIENLINGSNHSQLVNWCLNNDVSMVVVGPEVPLTNGIADQL